jgi:uncharacterized protein
VLHLRFMHPAIPRLVDVQEVDHKIATFQAELNAIPQKVRDMDARLAGAREDVRAAKEAHTTNLKDRKKLELDAQQWKERAKKYREQTASVKTNEAYKALLHEIANAEAEAAKAEDAQLEGMMLGDDFEKRVRSAEARLKEAETAVERDKQQLRAQGLETKKQLDAALAEREKLFATVPEDLRDLYTRIAKRHHGAALARVRNDQCGGCGMRVLPHVMQLLLREDNDEVFRCENCGMIFYTLEPPRAVKPPADSADPAAAGSSR